jgi:hypothetical protein
MFNLAENSEVIYGAQQLRGKNLERQGFSSSLDRRIFEKDNSGFQTEYAASMKR